MLAKGFEDWNYKLIIKWQDEIKSSQRNSFSLIK